MTKEDRIMKLAAGWAVVIALAAGAALASPATKAKAPEQRVQVTVTSRGFTPATIPARVGRPVVLVVTRTTDRTCAKEIVIAERKIRKELPLNRAVEIRLVPEKRGPLAFSCGMGMVSGALVVQ
jgi:plastocyanin domain-containing protein